jgi:hypothetical protein
MTDIYDGKPFDDGKPFYNGKPFYGVKLWTEMDVEDLTATLNLGSTIEDAAQHLCRSGTVNDVRRKVKTLGC